MLVTLPLGLGAGLPSLWLALLPNWYRTWASGQILATSSDIYPFFFKEM